MRAKGLLAAGRVDFQAGRWPRGVELCAKSRDLYREAGDGAGEARALIWLAFNRWGIDESQEIGDALAAAIDVARRAERPLETAIALGLSSTWWSLRDLDRAHELVEEGGVLMERAENPNWLAHSYEFRALVAYLRGNIEQARELLSDALPIYLQIPTASAAPIAWRPPRRWPRRPAGPTSEQSCSAPPSECASCSAPQHPPTNGSCASAASPTSSAPSKTTRPRHGRAAAISPSTMRWREPARSSRRPPPRV